MTKLQFKRMKASLEWVKEKILTNPHKYDQSGYCGTMCCIAGWLDVRKNGMAKHLQHNVFEVEEAGRDALYARMTPQLFSGALICLEKYRGKYVVDGTLGAARAACRKIDEYIRQRRQEVVA